MGRGESGRHRETYNFGSYENSSILLRPTNFHSYLGKDNVLHNDSYDTLTYIY
jgi:hypothetical protein